MHYLHSNKKVKGKSLVLKGKRVSQLRVCRRTGHRTIGIQYQLGEILQVMGQKHRPRMRPPPPGLAATLSRGTWAPPTPGLAPAIAQRSQTYLARLGCLNPKLSQAFCKDPPTSRQPSRRRLAGAGFPSRARAAAMASTTEGGGGATSQRSLRGAAGLPRVPSASASTEGLGKVFWSYSYAKWCRPGE